MKKKLPVLIVLLALGLLAAACSGDDAETVSENSPIAGDYSYTSEAPATTAAAGSAFTGSSDAGEEASDVDTAAQEVVAVLQAGRSIIYTANLTVEVEDVIGAGGQAQEAVAGLGAVLFGQETTTGPEPRSVLTFKVPPANFSEALQRLSGIGTLVSQTIYADDVTERVVDLASRITTAEASVERLRTFLEGATDLEGVAQLETELLQRETDLELLRGELRTMQDQVALATIVLVLTEPAPDPVVELVTTAYVGHDEGLHCPGSQELSLDEGESFTVCYQMVNAGDTLLGEIEVRDPGLDARFEKMTLVEGDPAVPLPPGGRLIFAFQAEADPDRRPAPQVQATVLDANGSPLRQQVEVVSDETVSLQVARDTSLPGFGDALSGGWHALQRLGGVAVVVGGALVPWLWIPALLILGGWWLRRRNRMAAVPASQPPAAPPAGPAAG